VHLRDGSAAVSAEKRPYRKVSLLEQAADEARKALLYRELSAMNGQVGRVAQRLGTNRTYCYALMKRYGIKLERRTVVTPKVKEEI
jgi:DNA-binding NtrC family response regulator